MTKQATQTKFDVPPEAPAVDVAALLAKIAELETNLAAAKAPQDIHLLEPAVPGVATASAASTKTRYRIIVEEDNDPSAPGEVTPSVNGRLYQIRRGAEVDVPPEVLHVLDNAIQTSMIRQVDSRGNQIGWLTRDSRRFPYTIIGKVIDENGDPVELPAYGNRMR